MNYRGKYAEYMSIFYDSTCEKQTKNLIKFQKKQTILNNYQFIPLHTASSLFYIFIFHLHGSRLSIDLSEMTWIAAS